VVANEPSAQASAVLPDGEWPCRFSGSARTAMLTRTIPNYTEM
jgi:hypothetical protein